VQASRIDDVEHGKIEGLLYVELIIECKNTTAPFVLVGETIPNHWFADSIFLSFDPLRLNFPGRQGWSLETRLPLKRPRPPSAEESFIGNQLLRMNRQSGTWRADNSAVYDSILYPLAKASNHYWREITEGDEDFDKNAPWKPPYPYLAYLIPVIVTAGPVYTVDAVSDEAKHLVPSGLD
jgi:hypothetical protein